MQASHSPRRATEVSAPRFAYGWLPLAIVLAVLAFIVVFLPASTLKFFLPATVSIEDASGTVWHGSIGKLAARGVDLGSVEWQLRPSALLSGSAAGNAHWVRRASLMDAEFEAKLHGVTLRNVQGSGVLADWADLGALRGWNGQVKVAAEEIDVEGRTLRKLRGIVTISNLSNPQQDAVGSYEARFDSPAASADGTAHGAVRDLGGPLELQGTITLASDPAVATISGNMRERADVPPRLHTLIEQYASLAPRNAAGFIPVDFEVAL